VIHGRSVAMIEHKAGEPERLVAVLERLDLIGDVLVQSFDWKWLEEVHRLEPRLTIGALGNKPIDRSTLTDLQKTGAAIAHWRGHTLRREDVQELRRRGYVVGAYTLNSDLEILGAAALGLHFITTDRPARLLAMRSEGALERR